LQTRTANRPISARIASAFHNEKLIDYIDWMRPPQIFIICKKHEQNNMFLLASNFTKRKPLRKKKNKFKASPEKVLSNVSQLPEAEILGTA